MEHGSILFSWTCPRCRTTYSSEFYAGTEVEWPLACPECGLPLTIRLNAQGEPSLTARPEDE